MRSKQRIPGKTLSVMALSILFFSGVAQGNLGGIFDANKGALDPGSTIVNAEPDRAMGITQDMIPPFLNGIALNDQQKDGVFRIISAQLPSVREQNVVLLEMQIALQALVTSDHYDYSQAQQLTNAIGQRLATLTLLHADTVAQLFALLTPEQRQQALASPHGSLTGISNKLEEGKL